MRKSSAHIEPTDCTLEQEAGSAAFPHQPLAAVEEPAPAVQGHAVTGDLLEAALPLDGGAAPHQPVVPCLDGLRLRADRQCAGPAGGGRLAPVQHHEVCGKG